jgi:hypothetical protein
MGHRIFVRGRVVEFSAERRRGVVWDSERRVVVLSSHIFSLSFVVISI